MCSLTKDHATPLLNKGSIECVLLLLLINYEPYKRNLDIYVYVYIWIYVYMYICIYVCMYVYICMYVCVYVCMYVCMYIYVCMCVYMSVYMYACMCVCRYVYVCTCVIYKDSHLSILSIFSIELSGLYVSIYQSMHFYLSIDQSI